MDHAKERLTLLARQLAEATAARGASWTLDDKDVYTWAADPGTLTIASRDRDNEPPYELTVYSPQREKVDELSSTLLDDDRPALWNDALAELYRAARRSALGADEIIDALIEALAHSDTDGEGGRQRSLLARARKAPGVEEEPS